MATYASSLVENESDYDNSSDSDVSIDDNEQEAFSDIFGETYDEEDEVFAGFRFEMPDVKWDVLGQPKRSADDANFCHKLVPRLSYKLSGMPLTFFNSFLTIKS